MAAACNAGACGYRSATGAACGRDGLARCNDAYVCLGPDVKLTAIRQHVCAVTDDGRVWCWGNNQRGELGDGTTQDRGSPVPVRDLPGRVVAATAGYVDTCVLLEDGTAYCWGDNTAGQTAPNSTESPVMKPTLVDVGGVKLTAIVAGQGHTCATTVEGKVLCWGNSSAGQCGVDPTDVYQFGPTEIPGLDQVTKLDTVKNHICAVRATDPTLVCWGSNQYVEMGGDIDYKLGPGTGNTPYSAVPLPVDLGARVVDVGLSYESTFAITEDGSTYSWGWNSRNELGQNTGTMAVATPALVVTASGEPLRNAKLLTRSDGSDQCVEMADLSLGAKYACWGGDDDGELGFGSVKMISAYARAASVIPATATNLVRGENVGCFTDASEGGVDVWCYGQNNMVGNGDVTLGSPQPIPARVTWDAKAFEATVLEPKSQ